EVEIDPVRRQLQQLRHLDPGDLVHVVRQDDLDVVPVEARLVYRLRSDVGDESGVHLAERRGDGRIVLLPVELAVRLGHVTQYPIAHTVRGDQARRDGLAHDGRLRGVLDARRERLFAAEHERQRVRVAVGFEQSTGQIDREQSGRAGEFGDAEG